MDVQALLAPDAGAPLGQSRAHVLDLLRAAGSPAGVRDIAGQAGLHPNTARFHLDALVDAGLAARAPKERTTPGRPSMAYRAVAGGETMGRRRYRLLAEMLTSLIAGMLPKPGEAVERLTATLAEIGFAPEAVTDGTQYQLRLRQCPFREVAENHQDVVCQLHLGLMQGALAQMRAPVTADRLQPFAEPSLCIAYLATRQNQASAGS
ncbi:MAG TPA: helix-turn-helix domain-containing protein [Streptosporangiaceae bacterium]|nr:helix-turn-helix domain-containing protein [Streptosporangiaceae bacterium]